MGEYNPPLFFGEWLRHRRKMLDLTQEELARHVGCSVFALRKIESGERRPSKQLAGLMAKALDISAEDLPTFIRVARRELNAERLRLPEPPSLLIQATSPRGVSPSAAAPVNRIPMQGTPLIGREREIAALEKLFIDPQCRLLTLTGMGGIGKTHLAIEFAFHSQHTFPGGIFYIPLAPLNTPEDVLSEIANVLEYGFSGPNDPRVQLLNYISDQFKQPALLVLDNLEHLLVQEPFADKTGVVELITEILQHNSNVKILGTSRERLNLPGEWTYELHGLSVPPPGHTGGLESYDAIALFMKSAQRIQADFHVGKDEQQSLVEICQLVDGVPLAIKLAAAWVGVLSCKEIAQEIKSNMDILTTSMRGIPERHRSIHAAVDHSWNLLTNEERLVLSQLAIFEGGFNRQAAKEIAGATLPLMASLNAKSLIRRAENGRYDLHEVIRQYTLQHLNESTYRNATYGRHCAFYLTFAQERERPLKAAGQQEAVRELTDEIDNILAAWRWAIDQREYALLEGGVRALGWYFEIAGIYREGIEQLELLVQAIKTNQEQEGLQRLLGTTYAHQGLLYFRKGEFAPAQRLYEESIAILRSIGDEIILTDALVVLGVIDHINGNYPKATAMLEEGQCLARANGLAWYEAYTIYNLGYIDSLKGHYAEGYEQMIVGLEIWRKLGEPHSIALGMNYLVTTLIKLCRYDEAKTFMHESIALCEQSKNRWGMGTAYRYLGLATMATGQYAEAQGYFRKSIEIFGEHIIGWDIARSLTYMGDAKFLSADFEEARKDYQAALRLSTEIKAVPITLSALAGLSVLQAQNGNAEQSLAFAYHIINNLSCEEVTRFQMERLYENLKQKLSASQVEQIRAQTDAKTFELIVEEALETASNPLGA